MPAVMRDDWFQSCARGAPPQSSPGNLIQPSGRLGFIQFRLRPRPKRARGYFRMMDPHPPDCTAFDIQ
jgi:hypothetical protein